MKPANSPPRSAYIHVPFCAHRCGYCSFTVVAHRDDLVEPYLRALSIELAALQTPRPVDTLFLGGGTPTQLPLDALARLLELVLGWFPLAAGGEFSVEANPANVAKPLVELLAQHGVNRISLGGQSFDEAKLRLLERDHSAGQLRRAFELARRSIDSVCVDLIFGTPGESLATWQKDLRESIALEPDHVSTYGLTFERGTTFWSRLHKGQLARLDEEAERTQYATAIDALCAAGFEHYEVSNFARPLHRCRHNEAYWNGESYFAAGPGAARYVDGRREMNHRSTTTWIARLLAGRSPVAESEELSPEDRARERLVFGLRRLEGVDRAAFAEATGHAIDELVGGPLARFVSQGLLSDDGRRIRLTRAGLFISDALWPHFLR